MAEGFVNNNTDNSPEPMQPPPMQPPTSPISPKNKFNFKDFLNFNTMVTPTFIKWYYIAGSVLLALSVFISAIMIMMFGGFMVFAGLLAMLIGIPIVLVLFRVSCELMAVIFSIHKELRRIK